MILLAAVYYDYLPAVEAGMRSPTVASLARFGRVCERAPATCSMTWCVVLDFRSAELLMVFFNMDHSTPTSPLCGSELLNLSANI